MIAHLRDKSGGGTGSIARGNVSLIKSVTWKKDIPYIKSFGGNSDSCLHAGLFLLAYAATIKCICNCFILCMYNILHKIFPSSEQGM